MKGKIWNAVNHTLKRKEGQFSFLFFFLSYNKHFNYHVGIFVISKHRAHFISTKVIHNILRISNHKEGLFFNTANKLPS